MEVTVRPAKSCGRAKVQTARHKRRQYKYRPRGDIAFFISVGNRARSASKALGTLEQNVGRAATRACYIWASCTRVINTSERWNMTLRALGGLLKSTASKWSDHNAPRLGAALAYYMLLSIAPLVILLVALCGIVFNKTVAEQELLRQIRDMAGATAANTVRILLENAGHAGSGIIATTVALIALLFGASGVFVELRESLNTIWDAPRRRSPLWRTLVWQRLVSFAMVLA